VKTLRKMKKVPRMKILLRMVGLIFILFRKRN
jgi:hypothetical protein